MGILRSLEIDYSYDIVEEFLSHYALMCELMEPLIIGLTRADRYSGNIDELDARQRHPIPALRSVPEPDPEGGFSFC